MDITTAIDRLTWLCQHIPALIDAIPVTELESKPAPEKWSKKEILGHLIDSAANNHQRFIRIQSEDEPVIFYNQNDWVGLSRHNDIEAAQLIATWKHYNLHLAAMAKAIAPENAEMVFRRLRRPYGAPFETNCNLLSRRFLRIF
jgi:hypothetical protein